MSETQSIETIVDLQTECIAASIAHEGAMIAYRKGQGTKQQVEESRKRLLDAAQFMAQLRWLDGVECCAESLESRYETAQQS